MLCIHNILLPGKKDLEFVKSLSEVQGTEPSSTVIDLSGTRINTLGGWSSGRVIQVCLVDKQEWISHACRGHIIKTG